MSEPVHEGVPHTFQQDALIAHEAALALERAVRDPEALAITSAIYENQHDQDIYLEAVEREIKRKKFDGHLANLEVFNKEGIEALLITQALKMKHDRFGSAQGAIVVIMDLDGLKKINDQLGHPTGDKALYGVAEVLRQALRNTDDIGRFGGDEFIAFLPLTEDNPVLAKTIMEEERPGQDGLVQKGIREKFREGLTKLYQGFIEEYGDKWPKEKDGARPGMASLGWHYFSRKEFLQRYQEFLDSPERGKLFVQKLIKEADENLYKFYKINHERDVTPV